MFAILKKYKNKEGGFEMFNFIIVQVDYKYCDYLRNFDKKVPYNSGVKRTRPFLGVLFKINDIEYFTPLSSPKEKHKKMKNSQDFIKLDNGELGAININNMIPIPKEAYKIYDFSKKLKTKKEIDYHSLLSSQLLWLNKNEKYIKNRAKKLYDKYISKNMSQSLYSRCCNFSLLEEKCQEYKNKEKITSN